MAEITNSKKWWISILSGLIFIILASPMVLNLIGSIGTNFVDANGCPNLLSVVIAGIIFILITRLLMN